MPDKNVPTINADTSAAWERQQDTFNTDDMRIEGMVENDADAD